MNIHEYQARQLLCDHETTVIQMSLLCPAADNKCPGNI